MKDVQDQEDKEMEESKESSIESFDSNKDVITTEDVDQINEALRQINTQRFEILQASRFHSTNSFVQACVVNDDFTNIILTCSDRVLRLYSINYRNLLVGRRAIIIQNEFQDVINRRKWMNACFLKLNSNTQIFDL